MPNHLTMKQFGHWGRFANQLFEYAFLKIQAEMWGLELQLPPWVGNVLFGCNEPPVTVDLPAWEEHNPARNFLQTVPPEGPALVNRDFRGYAQHHTSWYRPWRKSIWQWLSPAKEVRARVAPLAEELRHRRPHSVGIHLRRGDYGQLNFYITPVQWYLQWLDEHWERLKKPALFIATEDQRLVEEFRQYRPVTAGGLGCRFLPPMQDYQYLTAERQLGEAWRLDFYPDFYLLTQCDVILAPNSTFSVVAAMLNRKFPAFWRSNLLTQRFHKEDPWDAWPFQRELVDDYPVPGTFLEHNPPFWDNRTLAKQVRQ
jgi:hypothetical protein